MTGRAAVRPAVPADVPAIVDLIHGLAVYGQQEAECHVDETRLREHLFGSRRYAEVLVADAEERIVGFALFFHNYSTFQSLPGLYLEDLFVQPEYRGRGIGTALLRGLVAVGAARGCGRIDWLVQDWNAEAIGFYEARFGARPVPGMTVYRMTDREIHAAHTGGVHAESRGQHGRFSS